MSTDSTATAGLFAPPNLPPPPRMTYEAFLDWHPNSGMAEWVDGEAFTMAPPETKHQQIAVFLLRCLSDFAEAHDLGEVFMATVQMRLPNSGREPDVLFVAAENRARVLRGYLNGPADLAIEVVSPESRSRDRKEKLAEYQQAGVREYWIIDPIRKEADFYVLNSAGSYETSPVSNDGVFHSRVLAGLWLQVDWLWQEPLPKLATVLKSWGLR